MKTFLFLANGFEEIEALATVDILRRAEINVEVVSINETKEVIGAHKVKVVADKVLNDVLQEETEMMIFPGGMPGAGNLGKCTPLMENLQKHHAGNGWIAAICAAPAMVFGQLPLEATDKVTCYPGFESYLSNAEVTGEGVVVEKKMITAKGPAFAIDFALMIVEQLKGKEKSDEVGAGLLVNF